ncbi:MAG: PD-(D/E)XK nuclease family protein, partial [Rhodothermaceae bacterium]|nr:PD-(D/E)XK nuclease family protein [Rhodothermaceae bacterium]
MALKIITSSSQTSLAGRLADVVRESGDVQGITILLPTRASVTWMRRFLQRELNDFAPRLDTLEGWIGTLALLSIDPQRRPAMVLSPAERLLALEFFLQTEGDGNHGFSSRNALKAGASIAGDLQRAGRNLADLLTEADREKRTRDPRFANILARFGAWLDEKKWYNREAVPALLDRPDPVLLPEGKLILFEIDHLFETQKRALDPVISAMLADGSRDVIAFQTIETADFKGSSSQANADSYVSDYLSWLIARSPDAEILTSDHEDDPRSRIAVAVVDGTVIDPLARPTTGDSNVKPANDDPKAKPTTSDPKTKTVAGPGTSVILFTCHDERAEIEHALRTIIMEMAFADGNGGMQTHNDGRSYRPANGEPHQNNNGIPPKYSDYVIMTGNTNRYRPLVKALAKKYRIPVDIQPADPMISNPVVRRFIRLLELETLDFSIDAIYEIFADNLFTLPGLKIHNEEKAPNIRFRLLDEATRRIDDVKSELQRKRDEAVPDDIDPEKMERAWERNRREMDYYEEIVGLLQDFRSREYREKQMPLSDRVAWALRMVESQRNLGSGDAYVARNRFAEMLNGLLDTYRRLELDPELDQEQFIRLVRISAGEAREKAVGYPNGVLFCDITHFPLTGCKKVFITGLHEGGLVTSENMDFLRFRYQKELGRLLRGNKPEAYLKARFHLLRHILRASRIVLTRPLFSGNQKVIGSVIWQDLLHSLGLDEKEIRASGAYMLNLSGIGSRQDEGPGDAGGKDTAGEQSGSQTDSQDGSLFGTAPDTDPQTWKTDKKRVSGDVAKPVIWCLDEHERDMLRSESIIHTTEYYYVLSQKDHPALLAAISNDREDQTRIGAWDGMLSGFEHPDLKTPAEANVRAWWNRELQRNRNQLPLSISRLDEYAASPLDYFFNRILRLQPLEQYQDDAESNVKGLIVHSILQHFYTPNSPHSRIAMVHPSQDLPKARQRLDEIIESILDEYGNQLGYADSPFPELLKTNIRKLSGWFLRAELEIRDKLNEDTYLPASFVPEADIGMEYRWTFSRNWNGTDVLMNGLIDRIDVHPELKKAVVYDYKTGTYVKTYKNITDGMSYQLPMYFLALKEIGFESLGGAYYKVPIGKKAVDVEADYHFGSLEVLGNYADN